MVIPTLHFPRDPTMPHQRCDLPESEGIDRATKAIPILHFPHYSLSVAKDRELWHGPAVFEFLLASSCEQATVTKAVLEGQGYPSEGSVMVL